jgi:hypothetical protein
MFVRYNSFIMGGTMSEKQKKGLSKFLESELSDREKEDEYRESYFFGAAASSPHDDLLPPEYDKYGRAMLQSPVAVGITILVLSLTAGALPIIISLCIFHTLGPKLVFLPLFFSIFGLGTGLSIAANPKSFADRNCRRVQGAQSRMEGFFAGTFWMIPLYVFLAAFGILDKPN